MPRIRSIKPDFFKSLTIGDLSPTARLTFIGLWCYADDNGVAVDDARLIRAEIWPLDETPEILQRIREDLSELEKAGLITRYTVAGKPVLSVNSWFEHQKVSHPKESRFPRPEELDKPQHDSSDLDPCDSPEGSGENPEDSGRHREASGGSRSRARARVPCSLLPAPSPEEGGVGGGDEQPPAKPELTAPAPSFDDFWAVYPRKVNKTEAHKAWKRALKRGVDPEQVIAAARIYRDDPRRASEDIKYTAHAKTWLNQERYADEPEPAPQADGTVVPLHGHSDTRPSTTDQRVAAGMALVAELQALEHAHAEESS